MARLCRAAIETSERPVERSEETTGRYRQSVRRQSLDGIDKKFLSPTPRSVAADRDLRVEGEGGGWLTTEAQRQTRRFKFFSVISVSLW